MVRAASSARASSPAGAQAAMLLPTVSDPSGVLWTARGPSAVVLNRVAAVARRCAALLAAGLVAGFGGASGLSAADIFTPQVGAFDVFVALSRRALPFPSRGVAPVASLLRSHGGDAVGALAASALAESTPGAGSDAPGAVRIRIDALPKQALRSSTDAARGALLVGFDPAAALLSELTARFGHLLLWFRDGGGGGELICGAFRPGARDPLPQFRLPMAACAAPAPGLPGGTVLNTEELLEEASLSPGGPQWTVPLARCCVPARACRMFLPCVDDCVGSARR